ncbi:hypothetical protein DFQ26_004850 [Actinomortierella ambigua]|nr:hypothetical protein DFQ26_004850 [Actinomortierella ambigua]
MHKSAILVLAVYAQLALGEHTLILRNNTGGEVSLTTPVGTRACVCLIMAQKASIRTKDAGDVKLFKTTSCTGSYTTIPSNTIFNNAYWVNSVSFGKRGISQSPGYCPHYFDTNLETAHTDVDSEV